MPLVNGDPVNIDKLIANPQALLLEIVRDNKRIREIVTNQHRAMEHLTKQIKKDDLE